MNTTHRNYQDEANDFNLICHFIYDYNHQIRKHSTWCIGRFVDWKYALWGDKLSTPGFWSQNAHLWFDGFGKLIGFAISENGGSDIAIITSEGFRFLFDEILLWVIENWGDRKLAIEITSQQDIEMRYLERHDFQKDSTFFRSHFDLTKELSERYPLSNAYEIVSMKTDEDYLAQLHLRQNAFAEKTEISEEEVDQISRISRHSRENPIYHAETDLCVKAPEGIFVSGCEALIDTQNLEADIERVCTHSDYRRKGFAKAVIQECLYRLKEMGMKKAFITGYSEGAVALYNSIGADKRSEYYIYKHKGKK